MQITLKQLNNFIWEISYPGLIKCSEFKTPKSICLKRQVALKSLFNYLTPTIKKSLPVDVTLRLIRLIRSKTQNGIYGNVTIHLINLN
jgi:hypothetical protein